MLSVLHAALPQWFDLSGLDFQILPTQIAHTSHTQHGSKHNGKNYRHTYQSLLSSNFFYDWTCDY
jgi:hypothetical protein